ncbi:hypothetical protein AAX26_01886 [Aliarcobacter thereius]|uniref:Uncharacterized protein n=2 Tax=Aliarcobacter thereius TaxID=544718 RepID=A0A5R9GYZ5_9BACT|nr:hypothetical protein [Aliarcobacter thereius]OCL85460.1 hypothetical protein AAX26_01886 [Aliarcobacter thereius]OCL95845.1 hypothetical protein AA347_01327 [Aliarcobacter thereius LMG 24486]QBF16182.1 hypothetical protein ATH_1124 [Aliarcobacter thereius LMG 24486]TLS70969.1 hypothetical protein FE246_08360 [Aliarcobacter thereius]TLS92191.1 hypothetical protein FE244_07260 [Aliarcobacter thereius]
MRYLVFIIFILNLNLFAIDNKTILALSNIIEREEEIAKNYEKYILNEYKLPTMEDLIKEDIENSDSYYLGSNFSRKNIFGKSLSFYDTNARLNSSFDENKFSNEYLKLYYKRDLYRDRTSVYEENGKLKYVQIVLKTKEAQNIFKILSSGNEIVKVEKYADCKTNKYCINPSDNIKTIRKYTASDAYLIYNIKDLEKGNIYISKKINNPPLKQNDPIYIEMEFNKLNIGTIIFSDSKKYIKLDNGIYGVE